MGEGRRRQLIRSGLQLLLDAHGYAQDCREAVWEFAVEISQLLALGLNENEFRWLIRKGYVEHGLDLSLAGDEKRTFRTVSMLRFARKSCFVLTPRGIEFASSMGCEAYDVTAPRNPAESPEPESTGADKHNLTDAEKPFWDGERHELWLGNQLVKQFKRHARNQEAILSAFQEEGWPSRIDDPLAPEEGIEAKRRLNDTIKSLNRHQRTRVIRFTGDGTAEGIIWDRIDENGHSVCRRPANGHNE